MKSKITLFLSIYLSICSLNAQQDLLFDFLDQRSNQLTEHGAILASRLSDQEKNPTIKNSWVVRFQNFETNEKLNFPIQLPEKATALSLKSSTYFRQEIAFKDRTLVYDVWSGTLDGEKAGQGTFMLTRSKEGILGGHFLFQQKYYEIQSLDIQDALLLEKQGIPDHAYKCGLETKDQFSQETIHSSSNHPFCDPPPILRECRKEWTFLSVHTKELRDSLWNAYFTSHGVSFVADWQVSNDLVKGINNFTQMLVNNNIPKDNITWYGDRTPTAAIAFTQDDFLYLQRFTTYARQNFNSIYDPDITILQTHVNFNNIYGLASGIPVSNNGWNTNVSRYYAFANFNAIGYPRYTFAHEMGHCLGARHNTDISQPGLCSKGKIFNNLVNDDRTVMCFIDLQDFASGKAAIPYLSNPDQIVNGSTIGDANRNNKIVVHNAICGNWGTGTPRPALDLSGIEIRTRPMDIFPNPTEGSFLLPLPLGTESIHIFDSQGQIIQQQKLAPDQIQLNINISDQPNGLYFIRMGQGMNTKTVKILKND